MGHRDLYFEFNHIFQEVSKMACSKFVCGVYPMDEVGFFKEFNINPYYWNRIILKHLSEWNVFQFF